MEKILERNKRIDKINAVRRQAGSPPIDYKAGDDVLTAAENWDYVSNKSKIQPIPTPQVGIDVTAKEPQSLKPANLDQETYDFMLGQGIPQSRIDELYAPNEKNPFTRMFKESTPEPTPIDENKVQASRNLANLGEGVKVLGDMFGVSKGAHIERRNAGDITNKQQATEQTERDKYLAKLDQFNQGKRVAAEKDWMLALNDKEKGLKQVQADMNAQKAAEAAAKKAKVADDKWMADYNLKVAGLKQKAASDAERNRIAGIKANKDAKTEKKAEKDPNMIQVEVDGGIYWIRKAQKEEVVSRAMKDFGGYMMEPETDAAGKPTNSGRMQPVKDINGVPVPSEISKMTPDEIFAAKKNDYLRISDDGKYLLTAHKAGKFGNKPTSNKETSKQPTSTSTKNNEYGNQYIPKKENTIDPSNPLGYDIK